MTKLDEAAAQFRECRDRNEELQSRRRAAEETAAMAEREFQKINIYGNTATRSAARDRMFRAKAEVRTITAECRTAAKTLNEARSQFHRLNGTS
jgi:hypothetical protein